MKIPIIILIGLLLVGCDSRSKYKITLDDGQSYIITGEPTTGVYVNNSLVSDGISFNVIDEHGSHAVTTTRRIVTQEYLGEIK